MKEIIKKLDKIEAYNLNMLVKLNEKGKRIFPKGYNIYISQNAVENSPYVQKPLVVVFTDFDRATKIFNEAVIERLNTYSSNMGGYYKPKEDLDIGFYKRVDKFNVDLTNPKIGVFTLKDNTRLRFSYNDLVLIEVIKDYI